MFDFSVEKLVPLAVLAIGTVIGTLAQSLPELPAVTGLGEIGQLSAVGALIWILVRTLPAAFTMISEDRKLDRTERSEDRDAYRAELAEFRKDLAEVHKLLSQRKGE